MVVGIEGIEGIDLSIRYVSGYLQRPSGPVAQWPRATTTNHEYNIISPSFAELSPTVVDRYFTPCWELLIVATGPPAPFHHRPSGFRSLSSDL